MTDSIPFDFQDAELSALLEHPELVQPAPDELADDELITLTRGLAAQYVDVLALYVSRAFAGAGDAQAPQTQTLSALDALIRLSRETGDAEFVRCLEAMASLVTQGVPQGKRARSQFLRALQAGVVDIAACLDPESGKRLRGMVLLEDRSAPLLAELERLRGIGPRRLERLYCAGLFTVESVSRSAPDEIAEVTGLPRALAAEVVEATQRFAEEERRRCVVELQRRVEQFARALPELAGKVRTDVELLQIARSSLQALQQAMAELERTGENA